VRRSEDFAEAFGYVDACLSPSATAAFERRLESDPDLKRQVEVWRKQNVAIRKAFETRRTTGDSSVAIRAAANANRSAVASSPANVAQFPGRELPLVPTPALAEGDGRLKRVLVVLALAALALLASATWRPNRAEAFRAEASSAWQAYRTADVWPPLDSGRFDGTASLAAIMAAAWPVPASPTPARFAFDTAKNGQRFGVLVGDSDGVPAFAPMLAAQAGTTSAVWSDGRRLIALVGEGGGGDALAEAWRLSRP